MPQPPAGRQEPLAGGRRGVPATAICGMMGALPEGEVDVRRGVLFSLVLLGLLGLLGSFWWLEVGPAPGAGTALPPVAAPHSGAPLAGARALPAVGAGLPAAGEGQPQPLAAGPDRAPPAPTAPPPSTPFATLHLGGRLVDPHGRPVADALVICHPSYTERERRGLPTSYWVEPPRWDALPSSRSAADGRFDFSAEECAAGDGSRPPGGPVGSSTLALVVSHPAFRHAAFPVPGTTWTAELGDLVLEPGAQVVGRCVDEYGQPIAGVQVGIPPMGRNGWSDDAWTLLQSRMSTSSGDDGRFVLGALWPGEYGLEASHPGRRTWSRRVEVPRDEPLELGDLVLDPGGVLAGRVLDAQGRGLADALVKVRPASLAVFAGGEDTALRDLRVVVRSNAGREETTRTDAAGEFRFDQLEMGPYGVFAHLPGYEPAALRGLSPGAAPLQFVLGPEARLLLRVSDAATGAALPHATARGIRLSRPSDAGGDSDGNDPALEVLSGAAAAERLGVDSVDEGLLVIGPLGFVGNRITVEDAGHAPSVLELPGAGPGEQIERSVSLAAAATLAGRVHDEQGLPLAGATLTVVASGARASPSAGQGRVRSDADGRFRSGALAAGSYRVQASLERYLPSEELEVALAEGEQRSDLDLLLRRGATLVGQVFDVRGAPAGGRTVALAGLRSDADLAAARSGVTEEPDWSDARRTVSDQDGSFRFEGLPAGSRAVSTEPGDPVAVALALGRETSVVVTVQDWAVVSGRVFEADGRGAPAAHVELYLGDPQVERWAWKETETDSRGDFSFGELEPGSVRLLARSAGATTPPAQVALRWGCREVVDLRFADGVIAGRMLDEQGQAVPDVHIEARRSEGLAADEVSAATAQGDATGAYRLERLLPGRYVLSIRSNSYYLPPQDPLELTADEHLERTLTLRRGGEIRGRVRTNGKPEDGQLHLHLQSAEGGFERHLGLPFEGEYHIGGLPGGRYRYEVRRNGHYPPLPDQEHVFASAELQVIEGQALQHDILLVPKDG